MPDDNKETLGSAFHQLFLIDDPVERDRKIQLAIQQMSCLANGEEDAVAVTRLTQLGIDIPLTLPLWNDKDGNAKYWPEARKWSRRQLGLEKKDTSCPSCKSEDGFDFNRDTGIVTCRACGAVKARKNS